MTLNTEAFAKALAAGIAAYEAAVVGNSGADSEGWIEWGGGDCPVEPRTFVKIQLRAETQEVADADVWSHADDFYWDHRNDESGSDIIAYRVSK